MLGSAPTGKRLRCLSHQALRFRQQAADILVRNDNGFAAQRFISIRMVAMPVGVNQKADGICRQAKF